MKTTTCDICKKEIDDVNPKYDHTKELSGRFAFGSFTFQIVVDNFHFNSTNIDLCQSCLHASVVDALKK